MVKLVALKSRRFGTVSVRAGETFHASRRYARIWKALGLAADPMPLAELRVYSVPPPAAPAPGDPETPDLAGRTKAELLEIAAAGGVEVPRHATKAEIIAAITAHLSQPDEAE